MKKYSYIIRNYAKKEAERKITDSEKALLEKTMEKGKCDFFKQLYAVNETIKIYAYPISIEENGHKLEAGFFYFDDINKKTNAHSKEIRFFQKAEYQCIVDMLNDALMVYKIENNTLTLVPNSGDKNKEAQIYKRYISCLTGLDEETLEKAVLERKKR